MRLIIQLDPVQQLQIAINYNQSLQGLLYHAMEDREFATFLHEQGYMNEKRSFRLFTFSRLMGNYSIDKLKKQIIFEDKVTWQIGSAVPKLIRELGRTFLKRESLYLNNQEIRVGEISYKSTPEVGSTCRITMLSPITIYSTYEGQDSKKITQYFDPDDAVFSHLIEENMRKKYFAYHGIAMPGSLTIRPVDVTKKDKVITRFKDFLIEGWNGVYELKGEPEVLQFAYGVGLAGRNAQGFGMFEFM